MVGSGHTDGATGDAATIRESWTRPEVFGELVARHEPAVFGLISARLERELAEDLAALSADERDVVVLVAVAELSPNETARALEIPSGTVRSRLHRARAALRGALASTATGVDRTRKGPPP